MRERLLQTRKFSVERITWAHPDEGERTHAHEIIVHPGAVVVLPILENGDWVLIRNHRPAVGRELLELPAGTLEPGEAPPACARRELEEETGFQAERLEPLLEFYTSPGVSTERMYGFVARGLTEGKQNLEPSEYIHVQRCRPQEVRRWLFDGTLEDGKTLAMLAAFFLREPT